MIEAAKAVLQQLQCHLKPIRDAEESAGSAEALLQQAVELSQLAKNKVLAKLREKGDAGSSVWIG